MKTIVIHDGSFHTDDLFACAILKLIYPDLKIIRTRDPEKLKKADARVDVGRVYNHKTLDYDHHQSEFREKRKNGIPFASAGLIWKHYGEKLVDKKSWKMIDEKVIQFVDANDNGLRTHKKELIEPYSLDLSVEALNSTWDEWSPTSQDSNFKKALEIVIYILQREIKLAKSKIHAEKVLKGKLKESEKDYTVLEGYISFQDFFRENSKIKFVIFPRTDRKGAWAAVGVRKYKTGFEIRKKFPEKWAGLSEEELQKATGVKDALFCHKDLFMIVAGSKESAIKMVEMALEERQ